MIVVDAVIGDFLLHALMFFAFGIFAKKIVSNGYKYLFGVSVVLAALVTALNNLYFPQFKKEGYENCYLRWGVKPCDCPYAHSCPLRRTCMRGDPNAESVLYR